MTARVVVDGVSITLSRDSDLSATVRVSDRAVLPQIDHFRHRTSGFCRDSLNRLHRSSSVSVLLYTAVLDEAGDFLVEGVHIERRPVLDTESLRNSVNFGRGCGLDKPVEVYLRSELLTREGCLLEARGVHDEVSCGVRDGEGSENAVVLECIGEGGGVRGVHALSDLLCREGDRLAFCSLIAVLVESLSDKLGVVDDVRRASGYHRLEYSHRVGSVEVSEELFLGYGCDPAVCRCKALSKVCVGLSDGLEGLVARGVCSLELGELLGETDNLCVKTFSDETVALQEAVS